MKESTITFPCLVLQAERERNRNNINIVLSREQSDLRIFR